MQTLVPGLLQLGTSVCIRLLPIELSVMVLFRREMGREETTNERAQARKATKNSTESRKYLSIAPLTTVTGSAMSTRPKIMLMEEINLPAGVVGYRSP